MAAPGSATWSRVLHRPVDGRHSVIVVAEADWVIDLDPRAATREGASWPRERRSRVPIVTP
jgi:hypothetical protein